jgi:hypothetical protein
MTEYEHDEMMADQYYNQSGDKPTRYVTIGGEAYHAEPVFFAGIRIGWKVTKVSSQKAHEIAVAPFGLVCTCHSYQYYQYCPGKNKACKHTRASVEFPDF